MPPSRALVVPVGHASSAAGSSSASSLPPSCHGDGDGSEAGIGEIVNLSMTGARLTGRYIREGSVQRVCVVFDGVCAGPLDARVTWSRQASADRWESGLAFDRVNARSKQDLAVVVMLWSASSRGARLA